MSYIVDLQLATESDSLPAQTQFDLWVTTALTEHIEQGELTIRIVDAAESQQLNHDYRQKDKPTNVLSFPFDSTNVELDVPLLGDLVICAPVVVTEAQQQNKDLTAHWAHLTIHGCLHLLGFDHQADDQAEAMEAIEVSLLAQLGYDSPYEA
tara:strand:+ start:82991 stop:83446 length:456 start_codon:yes stop_codon:yes gene_type:complete